MDATPQTLAFVTVGGGRRGHKAKMAARISRLLDEVQERAIPQNLFEQSVKDGAKIGTECPPTG